MNKTTELLSKKQKILKLSDGAIKDLYTRHHLLKTLEKRVRKKFNQTITEQDKAFKQICLHDDDHVLYEAFREHLDLQEYNNLQKQDCSLEEAYFDRVTNDKFTDEEKIEIARKKLITTSECSGVPKAVLVHKGVEAYCEIEGVE